MLISPITTLTLATIFLSHRCRARPSSTLPHTGNSEVDLIDSHQDNMKTLSKQVLTKLGYSNRPDGKHLNMTIEERRNLVRQYYAKHAKELIGSASPAHMDGSEVHTFSYGGKYLYTVLRNPITRLRFCSDLI